MSRLRRFRKLVGPYVAVPIAGLLVGFVVATVVGTYVSQNRLLGNSGEAPEARAFVIGLVEGDTQALVALRPRTSVVQRALSLKPTSGEQLKTNSVTYLGGGAAGIVGIHIYVVEARLNSGRDILVPLSLTVVHSKVVRID